MGKQRATPRIVCCAIPIARAAGQVLLITSRKRPDLWVREYLSFSFHHPGHRNCICIWERKIHFLHLVSTSFQTLLLTVVFLSPSAMWTGPNPLLDTNNSLHQVPKGGYETVDQKLETAAQREALEEGPYPSRCPSWLRISLVPPHLSQCNRQYSEFSAYSPLHPD